VSVVTSQAAPREAASGGTLADVVGLILDKGLVIDIYVRVSLVGIEILTVDARVVVASVDTYIRFAEAAGRLNIEASSHHKAGLPELIYGVAAARSNKSQPAALEPAENGSEPLIDRSAEPVAVPRSNDQEDQR
jgi:gas vesicle structural protein